MFGKCEDPPQPSNNSPLPPLRLYFFGSMYNLYFRYKICIVLFSVIFYWSGRNYSSQQCAGPQGNWWYQTLEQGDSWDLQRWCITVFCGNAWQQHYKHFKKKIYASYSAIQLKCTMYLNENIIYLASCLLKLSVLGCRIVQILCCPYWSNTTDVPKDNAIGKRVPWLKCLKNG